MLSYVFSAVCSDDGNERLSNGNRLVKTLGPLFLYEAEQGHGISAMQFQLNGVILSVKRSDNVMILIFTGDLEVTGNGGSAFSDFPNLRTDKWVVTELPVRVEMWEADSPAWAGRTFTFEQTLATAETFAKNRKNVRIALKDLSMRFTEMGRVLSISAGQALFEEVR